MKHVNGKLEILMTASPAARNLMPKLARNKLHGGMAIIVAPIQEGLPSWMGRRAVTQATASAVVVMLMRSKGKRLDLLEPKWTLNDI